jgi:putative nucleotidyltransferase with HDIG domain
MPIHLIADTPARLAAIRDVLERKHAVSCQLLQEPGIQRSNIEALVLHVDLRFIEKICALKKVLEGMAHVEKRIFLVEDGARLSVTQAYALGATTVLVGQRNARKLLKEIGEQISDTAALMPEPGTSAAAAFCGETELASMFTAIAGGTPIDLGGTKGAGSLIADAVEEHGLADWLKTVRSHHEGTYQHCLLVTGIAVDFGLSLGVPKADLERIHMAAMFHDIGKAKIPLSILDKPGRLDSTERALVETHPVAGYEALQGKKNISAEILGAVRHHHEYLDGSGYPDGLCAESICDLVRVLTIADIFAALIESRAYKPTMPRAQAYDILCRMNGKLEKSLVNAFKEVALSR